jgi:protein gp37
LFKTISETPHLDWLLLTKRPENWHNLLQRAYGVVAGENGDELGEPVMSWLSAWLRGGAPPNVWVGTSVENQQRADERIPLLLDIPARVRFLSCEPLLGPVDLGLFGTVPKDISPPYTLVHQMLHWVIVGGESGPQARPMHPTWARDLRDQCQEAGVAFFFKQHGEWISRRQIADFIGEPDWAAGQTPGWNKRPEWREVVRDKEWGILDFDGNYSPETTTWNMREESPDDNYEASIYRVGKKRAGRELDGQTWDEFPEEGA